MKKYIIAGLFSLVVMLAACVSSQAPQNPVQPGLLQSLPLRPDLFFYVYKTGERITNRDGSVIVAEINLPNGTTIPIIIVPMSITSTQGRGAATEALHSDYDAIIAVVSETIRNNPNNIEAYIQRACLLFDRGRPDDLEQAINDCSTALKIDSSVQAAYYIRGMASAKLGDLNQAVSDMTTILNIREYESIGIQYILGLAYYQAGNIDQAIEMMEKVVMIDPDFADAAELLIVLRNIQ